MIGRRTARADLVVAVDVGNSKTDVVLAGTDGTVHGAVRGPTASHQAVGLEAATGRVLELVAAAGAGRAQAAVAVVCAAGADTPADRRRLRLALERDGLARRVLVRNDTDAVLRAGAPDGWGIALVCGAGVNCLGVAPGGRTARMPALGAISGDWGGGYDMGLAAIGAAIRARDGRGPRTILEDRLPPLLGRRRPVDVALALEAGRLDEARLVDLAPAVFAAAEAGDAVARAIVDRVADEQATMAIAAIRRLRLVRRRVPVVLAGGVWRAYDPAFHARFRERLAAGAPLAGPILLAAPPVLGAALLAFDEVAVAVAPGAADRLRGELSEARLAGAGVAAPQQ